jgi:putative Mg2+ transporter-C (MgtC) family protein
MTLAALANTAASLSLAEISARCLLAVLLGSAIGFNADRSRRPAGMRLYATTGLLGATIALIMGAGGAGYSVVAIAAALLSCSIIVGLICLGLILQQAPYSRPTPGLTASASLALVAILGLASGFGSWRPFLFGGGLAILLLKGGRFLRDRSRKQENPL